MKLWKSALLLGLMSTSWGCGGDVANNAPVAPAGYGPPNAPGPPYAQGQPYPSAPTIEGATQELANSQALVEQALRATRESTAPSPQTAGAVGTGEGPSCVTACAALAS